MTYNRRTVMKLTGMLTAAGTGIGTATAAAEPGVTVTESDGSTTVDEAGGSDDYSIVLDTQPAADVTVNVDPDAQLTTDTSSLTFTPLDWDQPQTVTVSAVDDATVETTPHDGTVTHTAESLDPDYDGIAVRDVTASITDNDVFSELEGPMTDVDGENETISVMGITVDVSGASFHSPTAELTFADLEGEPFPGRGSTPGFLDGTAISVGASTDGGASPVASDVEVIVAENVVVGPVTENTVPEGGSLADGTFAVQNTEANHIGDDRLPLVAQLEGTGLDVDLGTVPVGAVAAVEGYYAADGSLYAYILEPGQGNAPGDQTSIVEAQCDPSGDLEVDGFSSSYPETVDLYDGDGTKIASVDVTEDPEMDIGKYSLDTAVSSLDIDSCPDTIRAENSNGSTATSSVE